MGAAHTTATAPRQPMAALARGLGAACRISVARLRPAESDVRSMSSTRSKTVGAVRQVRGGAEAVPHLLLLPRIIYIHIFALIVRRLAAALPGGLGGWRRRFCAYGAMLDRFGRLEGTKRRRRARSARHLRRNRSF